MFELRARVLERGQRDCLQERQYCIDGKENGVPLESLSNNFGNDSRFGQVVSSSLCGFYLIPFLRPSFNWIALM